MTELRIPADALVVLVGASGSGKSTFAARHFRPTEVLSSDEFRAIVADDPADQGATREAFALLHLAARARLERGHLTVVDATSVTARARAALVALAGKAGRPAVAIVLDLPVATCRDRNASRPGRFVDEAVVGRQAADLRRSLAAGGVLEDEGFAAVHRLDSPAAIDAARVVRTAGEGPGTLATTLPARARTRRRAR